MTHSVRFGSREIKFHLTYSSRKTLGIKITPDLRIYVKAPAGASLVRIKEKVKKRAPWIIRQESFFLSFEPRTPPRQYVNGESHLFLGRQYTLHFRKGKRNSVNRKRNVIEVTARTKSSLRKLLLQWYRMHAKQHFAELAEPWIQRFKKYNVEPKGIYRQKMLTRWGSCTPGGKIILNPELIKAPKRCIEYVIVHELCHLVHAGHTEKFFALQRKMMPDWEKWKGRLERVMA